MHNPAPGNDTQNSWITRCPECSTAFRITRKHIEAAGGSVRCGSCLHVFIATKHIVGDNPFLIQDQPSSAPSPESSTSDDFDDTMIADDFDEDIDALIEQVNRESHQDKKRKFVFSDEVHALESESKTTVVDDSAEPAEDQDEAWARQMLREMEMEDDEPLWSNSPEPSKESSSDSKGDGHNPGTSFSAHDSGLENTQNSDHALLNNAHPSGLKELSDEPLTLHYQEKSRLKRALWPALNTIAVLALCGQLIAINFNSLALNPTSRPLIESMCSLITCNIPELRNINAIQTNHIVIRNDEDFENSLNVDAIITNHAPFAQPYPRAMLSITDSNQVLIGQRILSPAEYLSGEAAGAQMMPSGQPVHLSLKLISPGSDVNTVTLDFIDERVL